MRVRTPTDRRGRKCDTEKKQKKTRKVAVRATPVCRHFVPFHAAVCPETLYGSVKWRLMGGGGGLGRKRTAEGRGKGTEKAPRASVQLRRRRVDSGAGGVRPAAAWIPPPATYTALKHTQPRKNGAKRSPGRGALRPHNALQTAARGFVSAACGGTAGVWGGGGAGGVQGNTIYHVPVAEVRYDAAHPSKTGAERNGTKRKGTKPFVGGVVKGGRETVESKMKGRGIGVVFGVHLKALPQGCCKLFLKRLSLL